MCLLNARSLVNKLSKFQSFVYTYNFCITCVTETWLSQSIYDGEILPSDYVLYRKDRPSRGGGVLVAVKDFIPSFSISSPPDLEIVSVKLGQSDDLVICCVYVPPDAPLSYVSSLVYYLTDLTSSFRKCTFVGDFNFPDIDWHTLSGSSSLSNCFCNFVFDCNITQHVLEPTHVKGNILDLILTSENVSIDHLTIYPLSVVSLSDHLVISFDLFFNIPSISKSKPCYIFDFCRADFNSITSFLLDYDYSHVLVSNDIEFVWSCIKSSIYEAMSLFVPKVLIKSRKDPKWFDSDIRHNLKRLRTMKRKERKSRPSVHRSNKINNLEQYLQSRLLTAKAEYESNLIESCISSSVYSYIHSMSNSNTMPPSLHLDGNLASSDYEKATLFNQYFYSVFTRSSFQLPTLSTNLSKSICEVTFSELDVFCVLRSLDPTKAMGCDNISPRLLKHCALSLYLPLHHLFTLSLSQCYLPVEWRTHLIKPIFKSGDKSSVRNYRPISLLPVISKVLEKLVYNNIVDFVTSSISPHQFGFLHNRSTLQQLLIFFDMTLCSSESQTDVVYLDFRKAFDSVAHSELLYKLWKFGITGNLWSWLSAYLTNRVQYVSVGQSFSNKLPVISGVPQGSILGPVLFLIFINDLPTIFSFCKILLFADDAKCLMPISSQHDCVLLQNDLNRLVEWCNTWNLFLNEEKCSIIHFTKNRSPLFYSYSLNNKEILHTSSGKDLGLIVSNNFQWRLHYQQIISKAYKILGLLRRLFSTSISTRAKLTLYTSLVRSKLLYCSVVWRPHLLVDIKTLELVQRRATKFIVNSAGLDYRQRLIELHLLPLMMEFEMADILFFVKSLKYPSDNFNIEDFVQFCSLPTRSSTYFKLIHPFCRNTDERNHFFNRIPRLWNSLPSLDLHLPLSSLKSKLREIFWTHFNTNFDPLNECSYHYLCPCYKCSKMPISSQFTNNF